VSAAYDAGARPVFGASVATAAAALLGLLFIAVSINLRQILKAKGLPSRLVIGTAQTCLDLSTVRNEEETVQRRLIGRVFPALISCGCLAIGGATLIGQAGGGLYWPVPSVIAALVFGLSNVWVLLVEILR
jgi:hypothetical protein